ncbi:MAG: fibronectin type III domain-containing protein [Phycisphaera sp.]|nr:MAG: fibronectin type III domain-containing protein [Phycisphaera sp.]
MPHRIVSHVLVCLALLFASHVATGKQADTTRKASPARVGPFLQDAKPTSIWIVWETEGPSPSEVRWGKGDVLEHTARGSSIPSQGQARIHHVPLLGLEPGASYRYRVRVPGTQTYQFRAPMPPGSGEPFKFVVYSDTQAGPVPNRHTTVINDGVIRFVRENFGHADGGAFELSEHLAFSLIPGDLVNAGSNYNEWKEQFFDEEQELSARIPIYPVPGNHEQDARWFFDYFHLPENGTEGFLEHWWWKDHGNVRIIGLDSNGAYRTQTQLDWLDNVLEDAAAADDIDFVFAQLHHPHLTPAWTPGNTAFTGDVVRRLERFSTKTGKPSIHFFGHTHAYERGQSKDHTHLWVDVSATEGDLAWWGEYPREDYAEFQKSIMDWGFVLMEVEDGPNPSFRMRRISRGNQFDPKDNEVIDDVRIRRSNEQPVTPELRSPASGSAGVPADGLVLEASSFRDPDGDRHLATQIQISTTEGDFSAPVRDEWFRFENWYAPPEATGRDNGYYSVDTRAGMPMTSHTFDGLDPFTTHYWRVRYRDDGLAWSEWSQERAFVTGAAPIGACCLPDGTSRQLRERDCISVGGTFLGVGSTDADCPDILILWKEDFEAVQLGPNTDETRTKAKAWSAGAPTGWTNDRSAMPQGGVTEWRGWAIANKEWWIQASGDQSRSQFTLGSGNLAVADPDEWYDAPIPDGGAFDAVMVSVPVKLDGIEPGSGILSFDSTWDPYDDMRATIMVSYDDAEPKEIMRWTSRQGEPTYHAKNPAERVVVPIQNPGGAGHAVFMFRLDQAENDWYWAIDNLMVSGHIAVRETRPATNGSQASPDR